jgi:hypothetical protein
MPPTSTQPASGGHERVPALDLLRGFAAMLMVLNHVGYAALTPAAAGQGVSGALVFLGSFAPVLFFFATGVGAGLATRAVSWRPVVDKALLLLLADQFLRWSGGGTWGLDFFGFIAVSAVAAALAMATPRPVLVASVAAAAVLLLRYVVGKPLDAMLDGYGPLRWLLGVTPNDTVSYPGAPWLVYPLLGVACGVLHRRWGGRLPAKAWAVMGAVALLGAAGAALMAARGGSFHRWSSVAAAFFALSLVVLVAFTVFAMVLTRAAPRAAAVLSLGGVASFAVVPIHYAFARGGLVTVHEGIGYYLVVAAAICAASFWLSRAFEGASQATATSPRRRGMVGAALLVIVVTAVAALAWGRSGAVPPAQLAATLGQLAIGLLFAWRVGLLAPVRLPSR